MAVKRTAEMRRIGARNALIAGLLLLVLMLGTALVLSLLSAQSIEDALGTSTKLIWFLVFAIFIYTWIWGRSASGYLVLDCGPAPNRIVYWVAASMFVLCGLLNMQPSNSLPLEYTFWFSCALFYVMMGLGRVEIRENGIWLGACLFKWRKIQSYELSGDAQVILKIRTRSWFPFADRVVLLIPDSDRDNCSHYFEAHGVVRM